MRHALLILLCVAVGGCCVAEGTPVATPSGPRLIETLAVGDEVWTLSDQGQMAVGRVVRTQRHLALGTLALSLSDGCQLRVTGGHPILTKDGWRKAEAILAGQAVRSEDGWASVTRTQAALGPTWVVDLSVQPNANFIAAGVVVHNKSFPMNLMPEDLPGNWAGFNGPWTYGPYHRLELYDNATGLYGSNGEVYRVTSWSAGPHDWRNPYPFEASLEHADDGLTATLTGTVDWDGLSLKFRLDGEDECCRNHNIDLLREDRLIDRMAETKEMMVPYRGGQGD